MRVAQQLYEGSTFPARGQVGLITYMRTDSMNIADDGAGRDRATSSAASYGAEFALARAAPLQDEAKGAQEAHEAIRPTAAARIPDEIRRPEPDQAKLYRLIWQRAVASQMAEAALRPGDAWTLRPPPTDASRLPAPRHRPDAAFDGFRRVYFEGRDDAAATRTPSRMLPALTAEQVLRLLELLPEQHFTQPPAAIHRGPLVKALEENGIGRPSTYASIVST